MPAFEAALADFYGARFPEARAAFSVVLEARPGDPPTPRYLARLEEMCQAAVPPDFDGVLTLTEK